LFLTKLKLNLNGDGDGKLPLRETTFASGVAEAWPDDEDARGESWTACEEAVMADVEVVAGAAICAHAQRRRGRT
jgi:hypothetical protein